MNQIINSPTKITEKTVWTVFLAGPMKASPRGWRNKLVKAATEMGMDNITFISPRLFSKFLVEFSCEAVWS